MIVVGLGAATASVVLAVTMGFALVYECGGGEGSGGVDSTAWICSGPLDQAVSLAAFGVSLVAPVLGLGFSFKARRWQPLWVGIGAAIVNLMMLYVLMWEA